MPEIPDTPTNSWLAKLFTSEFIISAIITIFVSGLIWGNLNNSIASAQDAADSSAIKAERVEEAVNAIKTDVEVIKQKQVNAAEKLAEQSQELAEQRRDIREILRLVGGNGYERGHGRPAVSQKTGKSSSMNCPTGGD